ncbi:MAG TPA: thermonuclease family protein [Allosphingosinicella sp.]
MYAAVPGGFIDTSGLGETAPSALSSDPFAESRRSREIVEAQESGNEPRAGRKGASYAATGRVHVVDGDTLRIGGNIVRIADIDTPEMRGRCPSESALARRAKARLASLIQGESVSLAPSGDGRDEDQYGRKLRIVSVGGSNVGDQLIAEGLARPWGGRRMPWCA